ncbi:hypothetical protein EG329_003165 [Mollisiaceae sp. DMI_Dod_QoI]|nr:hypothetical protein EG329_003165 [Helotiales sp. DMI_Dod_QoI]
MNTDNEILKLFLVDAGTPNEAFAARGSQIWRTHEEEARIYESLQRAPETEQFRLITLLPDRFNGPIDCLLKRVKLVPFNDPAYISYEALSYVWGDPQDRLSYLHLNGALITVGYNLSQALIHLRRPDVPRVLWVDALCIDQNNIEERGHQVQSGL